jgi:hypothetical protein
VPNYLLSRKNVDKSITHQLYTKHSMFYSFDIKMMVKSGAIERNFKSLGPFGIYQLITTANPAPVSVKSGWIGCAD